MTGLIDTYASMKSQQRPQGFKESIPRGYKAATLQQFTPEQLQLFKHLFSFLGPESYLSKLSGGDEETFNQIERPAMKQFSELLGGIGSKFSGMGLGARRSSGFQNTTSQAASDFAQQLQSQRLGLQNQALQDLSGLSNMLLGQRPYERTLAEKGPSNLEKFLNYSLQAANTASKFYGGGAG